MGPPLDRRQSIAFMLVVVTVSIGSIAVVQATPSQTATASAEAVCSDNTYSPPDLDFRWTESYTDELRTGSEQDWSGGEMVRVGADGECSLLVRDGNSVSLDATTIDGTRGVVTGTVDLGANGSIRFDATGSSPTEEINRTAEDNETTRSITETSDLSGTSETSNPSGTSETTDYGTSGTADNNTTLTTDEMVGENSTDEGGTPTVTEETHELVISNPGPDYGTNLTLEAGEQSQEGSLSTGRFFQFALQHDNGTARIAVWNVDERWDGTWDLTVSNVSADEEWELTLDGRAFLDGISIGLTETNDQKTATGPPTAGQTTTDELLIDDEFSDPRGDSDFDSSNTEPDSGQSTSGRVLLGLIAIGGGALVIRFARPLTRFGEQLDAIGSTTRPSEVEAATWNVLLTKAVGVIFVGGGLFWIVSAFT